MLSFKRAVQAGVVAATLLTAQAASALTVDSFQFNGGLQVLPGSVATPASITFPLDFIINTENESFSGDLIGLTGSISGTYAFTAPGGATSVVLTSTTAGNTFTIDDGTDLFTADIAMIALQADGGSGGTIFGAIDFSSSSYAGLNPDLIFLNGILQNTQDLTITFQTVGGGGVNLTHLFQNGLGAGTYSAVVNANLLPSTIAEPAPLALLGLGLLCSAAYASRRRSSAQT